MGVRCPKIIFVRSARNPNLKLLLQSIVPLGIRKKNRIHRIVLRQLISLTISIYIQSVKSASIHGEHVVAPMGPKSARELDIPIIAPSAPFTNRLNGLEWTRVSKVGSLR